LEQDGEFYIT